MSEDQQVERVYNDGTRPLAVVLEPAGERHEVAPGKTVFVVARGPAGGALQIDRDPDEIRFRGWSGAQLSVVAHTDDIKARSDLAIQQMAAALRAPQDPKQEARWAAEADERGMRVQLLQIRAGERPPTARTQAEMEFAASLEPCATCDSHALGTMQLRGSGQAWELEGPCGGCGTPRVFRFVTRGYPLGVAHDPDELGPGLSLLITEQAFESELARLAPEIQGDDVARHRALVCMNELIKLAKRGPDRDRRVAQRAAMFGK